MNETIQKIIDIAFDSENRFTDDETVQLKVGDLSQFVRHYLAIRGALENAVDDTTQHISDAEEAIEKTKQLLNVKGVARELAAQDSESPNDYESPDIQ